MNYKRIDNIINKLVGLLIFILPLLPILSIQIPIYVMGDKSIIGSIREIIVILIAVVIFFSSYNFTKLKINYFIILLIIYILYGMSHIFIGNMEFYYAIDKFRLVYIYPLLYLIIYIYILNRNKNFKEIFSIKKYKIIFYSQIILVIFVAILELLYKEKILLLLYKDKYFQMHINLFGAKNVRIVSIMKNPINLGLFLNICLAFLLFIKFNKNKFKILRILMIILTIIITIFTLSRVAYLGMISIFFYYYFFSGLNFKKKTIVIFLVLSFGMIFGSSLYNYDNLAFRRFNQLSIENIKNNVRILNWNNYLHITLQGKPFNYLWGYGLGISNPATNLLDKTIIVENSYITILGEMGIIGLILYIFIIHKFFYNSLKIKKYNKSLGNFLVVFCIIFTIGSITNDMHQNNPFSFYFWSLFFYSKLLMNSKENIY